MKISILGAGRVGATLAAALATKGHDITIGHRDPQTAEAKWKGPPVRHAFIADAAAASPLIINATPGDTALDTVSSLSNALTGKILVDVSNATTRLPNGIPGGLLYPGSSLAEQLQLALPDTHVVKALNTMIFSVMVAPQSLSTPAQTFLSGNNDEAKMQMRQLLSDLGWQADWIVDLGGIESARATEALILMVPYLIKARGFKPFAMSVAY